MLAIPHVIFGTLREHYILLFGSAGAVSIVSGFVAGWIGARIGAHSGARQALREQAPALPQADARIDQLMLAVDAIGLEVERMAEGQRFTARLLSERSAERAMPLPRRESGTITPH